jgi:general L-amino acid transport system substrate-binding protein
MVTIVPRSNFWVAALPRLAFLLVGVMAAVPAHAELKLCAQRAGPNGPCTCKSTDDGPGQFTVVPKSRCGITDAKPPAKAAVAPAQPASPAPSAQEAPPPPPQETKAATSAEETKSQTQEAAPAPAPAAPQPTAQQTPPQQQPPTTTGTITETPAATGVGATLANVRTRGTVICGVNGDLVGFSYRNDTGEWRGLDVDFCRAVAAATLADPAKVEFVVVGTEDRFDVLKSGKIDLLTRNTTWNMSRETDLGLEFPGVLYYDGQSITAKQDSGLVSAQQLGGLRICVLSNTTSEKNLRYYFSAVGMTADIAALPQQSDIIKEYEAGTCAAYSGDRSALFSERLRFKDPAAHAVLPEVISKEPLGPVVRTGDAQWSKVVRWTLAGLVNAEEAGLSQQSLNPGKSLGEDAERLVSGAGTAGKSLGLDEAWLKNVVLGVGNYAEMFDRNLGGGSPLGMERGINALWKKGGILFAPPMW